MAPPKNARPLRFVQAAVIGGSSATCSKARNPRIDGTSKLRPQPQWIVCPACPVSTVMRELQAGQSSRYFIDSSDKRPTENQKRVSLHPASIQHSQQGDAARPLKSTTASKVLVSLWHLN